MFAWLVDEGRHTDSDADRATHLFIFLPLVTREVFEYVLDWNAHRIREQKNIENHVAGIPDEIYDKEGQIRAATTVDHDRYGFPPSESVLNAWDNALNNFGEFELDRMT